MKCGVSLRALTLATALSCGGLVHAQSFVSSNASNGAAFALGSAQPIAEFGVTFNAFLNHLPTVFTVDSFTFYAASGTPGDLDLVISQWSPADDAPVGNPLFRQTYSYTGGTGPLVSFTNMGVQINSHTDYVAYVTTRGNSAASAPSFVEVYAADAWDDPVDGAMTGNAMDGWSSAYHIPQYTLEMHVGSPTAGVVAAVPEPSTYALMAACLSTLALAARRRKPQV